MVSHPESSHPVIVAGGGFAGLSTALALSRSKPRPSILLIEPNKTFVFSPLLYELLSGELRSWEVTPPYSAFLNGRGIALLHDKVISVDAFKQNLLTTSGLTFTYSQLILATGSETNHFDIPGVLEHALMFKSTRDVEHLKERINYLNQSHGSQKSCVIVGAGSTGVELACKVSDLLNDQTTVHLIDLSNTILPNCHLFNQQQSQLALRKRHVHIHLKTEVESISAKSINLINHNLRSHLTLTHDCLIWTAGTKQVIPSIFSEKIDVGQELLIDRFLQVRGCKNLFAIGDSSSHREDLWPANAQVAVQQAQLVARNIIALRNDRSLKHFEFKDWGEMLSLGIGDATISALGLSLAGPLAFQIRRMIYLARFPVKSIGIKSASAWVLGN